MSANWFVIAKTGNFLDGWRPQIPGRRREQRQEIGRQIDLLYCDDTMPVYFLAIYAKNQRVNLSGAEKKEMQKLVKDMVNYYRSKGREAV